MPKIAPDNSIKNNNDTGIKSLEFFLTTSSWFIYIIGFLIFSSTSDGFNSYDATAKTIMSAIGGGILGLILILTAALLSLSGGITSVVSAISHKRINIFILYSISSPFLLYYLY